MLFGVPGLKRTIFGLASVGIASLALISCGSSSSSGSTNTGGRPSKLKSRAFVSNPLNPSGVAGSFNPVLNIVDAEGGTKQSDTVSFSTVGLSTGPGLMTLSPNGLLTLVFSPGNNTITVIDNEKESVLQQGTTTTTAVPALTLPGPTESMLASKDNSLGFAAVPTAPVNGVPPTPGAVIVFGISQGSTAATLPIPGARTIVASHNGNRILTMGDNSNTVTVITPSSLNTSMDPRTPVTCTSGNAVTTNCFDHPVWGIFSADDTQAYIFNCGPECGGIIAGITVVNMLDDTAGATLPLPASTYGIFSGGKLYVAGTPPGTPCGAGTSVTTCGTLSIVDVGTMTASAPAIITDGYHNRMDISANGQLFVGAKTCTNVTTSSETRGCLAIYNTQTPGVVVPPDNGDVTGVTAIPGRNVMYVCQGGNFRIYDTTTNKLLVPPNGQNMVEILGQSVDVKFVN
jgi:hypothetical protein